MTHPTQDARERLADLLPCPFCETANVDLYKKLICCNDCGASAPIDVWNRRDFSPGTIISGVVASIATADPIHALVTAQAEQIAALQAQVEGMPRWRVFEDIIHGYWGIELENAGNDDDPIMYPIKIHRDTVARIVETHNAALQPSEKTGDA